MRERVTLFGQTSARPAGLEPALIRAGFSLAEGTAPHAAVPDLVLACAPDAGSALERLLEQVQRRGWTGVPVLVLLGTADPGCVTRALSLGAADAVAPPVDLAEVVARLEARLRGKAELLRLAGARQSEDLLAPDHSRNPLELIRLLVQRIGQDLDPWHCACLAPAADSRRGRLIAVHEDAALKNEAVDLFHYPEVVEAAVKRRTVHAPEVLRDGLFLAHLAQWPDAPEVREIESAAAVPLVLAGDVRAVLVLRTRRGDPPLSAAQVSHVEQLVNATAALLEREGWRGEGMPGRSAA